MHRFKIALYVLLFLTCSTSTVFGQQSLSDTAKVSILTCGEGNELYSLFGHTAIRIQDEANALDVVYNYGTFDFRTENFYLKFVKGDLQYFVTAYEYNEFFYEYTIENRTIYEQTLNLTAIQKQQLFDKLNKSLLSDEKYYTYKFIDRNCTNMVVDKINQTLGKAYIVKTTEKDQTYRDILFPYLESHFYENLGINIIFGTKVDKPGERLFLPRQFMESLRVTKVNGSPIAEAPKLVLAAKPSVSTIPFWNNIFSLCLVLLLLVISRKAWVYSVYFTLLGMLGLFLSVVGCYSFHEELAWNYNVLFFNPLLLVFVICYWRKQYVWVKRLAVINLGCIAIGIVVLANKPNLFMFSPIIISLLLMYAYFIKKSHQALLSAVK